MLKCSCLFFDTTGLWSTQILKLIRKSLALATSHSLPPNDKRDHIQFSSDQLDLQAICGSHICKFKFFPFNLLLRARHHHDLAAVLYTTPHSSQLRRIEVVSILYQLKLFWKQPQTTHYESNRRKEQRSGVNSSDAEASFIGTSWHDL